MSDTENTNGMSEEAQLIIRENVPLAPLTTIEVGGPARHFVEAVNESQVVEALQYACKHDWPVCVLGGGSNLLISDAGFDGLVLRIALKGISHAGDDDQVITAGAGEDWDGLVAWCVENQLSGIECLSGIPGSVGGTPIQNVGAYGQEVGEVIESVHVLDKATFRCEDFSKSDCFFGYRSSIFNTIRRDQYVILTVTFRLRHEKPSTPSYPDLQRALKTRTGAPSLTEIREAVMRIRAHKSMLLQPGDPDCRSAGSFFKNPVVDDDVYSRIEQVSRSLGFLSASEALPRFKAAAGKAKLPAAWLIEKAGFAKGFRFGNAGISSKHTLALVNRGGAKAQEVLDLMRLIQDRVTIVFGIRLEPEPVFVGF